MRTIRCERAAASLALALSAAIWLRGADGYIVEGTVVDSQSRQPLANTRIMLAPATAQYQKTERLTKQDGRFSFPVAIAGKYTLQIAKPGYPPQGYKQGAFSGVESAIVVREDQDTRHIVFEAVRAGAISGQIKDEDSEPVGNALVAVFQSEIREGERKITTRGQVRANARGEFRFADLTPGSYYICAMGRPWFADSLLQQQQWINDSHKEFEHLRSFGRDVQPKNSDEPAEPDEPYSPDPGFRGTAFSTTFYPNSPNVESASLIPLESGAQERISITLPMTRAVAIKGKISAANPISGGGVALSKKIYNQYMLFLSAQVKEDGTFQFDNVPSGPYDIAATSLASSGPSSWSMHEPVEIGADDIEIQLKSAEIGSFSGHVVFDGKTAAPAGGLTVSLRNSNDEVYTREIGRQGDFSFERLPADRYQVAAQGAGYIAACLRDEAGASLPLSLEIAPGKAVHQDVVLAGNLAAIEGAVEHDGAPEAGAFVLLMPQNPSLSSAYRFDQTDSDGSFGLATIPPGDYFLIALHGGPIAYRDPKVAAILAQAAKPIHVNAADSLQLKLDIVQTAAYFK